ncbi:MAG: hypothetical protein JNK30_13350 [Phenylobacterium sp.]|uniref:hypothetical protein n=1 Tax=Phenylobacterium sp. TaxID=1871053 RepID=UPI001A5E159E|nr:hypothetical protein [Phenylobacterium sp.]MBL8772361.1 hypothetical protein [Phenylobacterium sp.]
MGFARNIIVLALLTAAGPAAAQILDPLSQGQLLDLRAQQEAAQRRAIDQANQLEALAARQRADEAALDLQLRRGDVGPRQVPVLRHAPVAPVAPASQGDYPSVPDEALADSNRKVQEAARNRR